MLGTDDHVTLQGAITGQVIAADDGRWDAARGAWNLLVDQRPAMVVLAADAFDVAATVRFARANGLRVAPQSTGHGALSLGDLDATILLRTGGLDEVRIDPVARTARVGAGVRWREVVDAAAEHGLVALHGSAASVGVVGYTLGGGLGWLARREGLAAHHVRYFEVVTADGELRRVDAGSDPELFWALRGGGGGQAIVTALEFELFPLTEAFAGSLLWPIGDAERIVHGYREWVASVPESVTSTLKLMRFPDLVHLPAPLRGREIIGVTLAFTGSETAGRELVRPLTAIAEPFLDSLAPVPGAALAEIAGDPPGPVPGLGDGCLLGELSIAACERLLELAGPGVQTPLLGVQVRHLGGALRRPPAGAGAAGAIDAEALVYGVGICPHDGARHAVRASLHALGDKLAPFAADRAFLSFNEHDRRLTASFPDPVADRLAASIRAYDPDGLFQANHLGR